MIFLSDPYSCEGAVSHSNDWLILLPVFKDGRLIAYTAMFGHMSDIGGKEITQGLVTAEGARNYGVVTNDTGDIDTKATETLRATMRAIRGILPLFNYGPGIEALRAKCETETGLPAPVQPVWQTLEAAK